MIKHMLKDLNNIMAELSAVMRNKSLSKEAMTEVQIRAFADFNEFYADETAKLSVKLSRLNNDIGVTDDVDFDRLLNISKGQREAIGNIHGIISAARDTLQLIA